MGPDEIKSGGKKSDVSMAICHLYSFSLTVGCTFWGMTPNTRGSVSVTKAEN